MMILRASPPGILGEWRRSRNALRSRSRRRPPAFRSSGMRSAGSSRALMSPTTWSPTSRSRSPRRARTRSSTPTPTAPAPSASRRATSTAASTVTVRDHGGGMSPRVDTPGLGVGLPVIAAIASSVEIGSPDGGGTEVRMRFALAGGCRLTRTPWLTCHRWRTESTSSACDGIDVLTLRGEHDLSTATDVSRRIELSARVGDRGSRSISPRRRSSTRPCCGC